ncbi:uncharacterized protein LOC112639130 [Camponotus floridanus]|uniref:uncharacterized protein LOC112639130 n=1 Tax=Camponotus floridanus TaxID=104421 RepID=UPI000DC6C60F|nr:uncharacterized protein LOC112639130 [Camponotus floridanus]
MDKFFQDFKGTNYLFIWTTSSYTQDLLREHEIKFERLMQRLRTANLKLQPDKCEFLRNEVMYLGHIIGSDGVRPDPAKVKAVMNFPIPKNPKNIKQFLGLAGYYRRFIPNFSKIAKPLTDLLKKDKKFEWTEKQTEAFDILRNSLCSEPILQYPDFSKPFVLTTDASGYAVGGVLSQGIIGKDYPSLTRHVRRGRKSFFRRINILTSTTNSSQETNHGYWSDTYKISSSIEPPERDRPSEYENISNYSNREVTIEEVPDSEDSQDRATSTHSDVDYADIFDSNIVPYGQAHHTPPPWTMKNESTFERLIGISINPITLEVEYGLRETRTEPIDPNEFLTILDS